MNHHPTPTPEIWCGVGLWRVSQAYPAEKGKDFELGDGHMILAGNDSPIRAPEVLRKICPYSLRGPHFSSPFPQRAGFPGVVWVN